MLTRCCWALALSWRISMRTPPLPSLKLLNMAWLWLAFGVEGKTCTSMTGFFGGRPRFLLKGGYDVAMVEADGISKFKDVPKKCSQNKKYSLLRRKTPNYSLLYIRVSASQRFYLDIEKRVPLFCSVRTESKIPVGIKQGYRQMT